MTCQLVNISNRVVSSRNEPVDIVSSIPQMMFKNLENRKDEIVLIDFATSKSWTGAELSSAIQSLGTQLLLCGVNKGDVVGFFCEMSDIHAIALLAFMSIGAIYSGSMPMMPYDEILNKAKSSSAKFGVFSKNDEDLLQRLPKDHSFEKIFVIDSDNSEENSLSRMMETEVKDLSAFQERMLSISKTDMVRINFSSGTTGSPKPMTFTHEATAAVVNISEPGFEIISPGDVVALSNPFVFGSGFHYLIHVVVSEAKGVVFPKFDAEDVIQGVERYEITFLFLLPSLIVKMNEAMKDCVFGPHIKKVLTAGEVLFPKVAVEFVNIFRPLYFGQYYGSTEIGFATLKPLSEGTGNLKSVGIPMNGVSVKVISHQTGEVLPANAPGELYVKTPMLYSEYINNETATKACFDDDGYFKTGDSGYYDDNGYFYFIDRYNQMIVVRGVEHPVSELEMILADHEAVSEVAIIAVPHEEYGQCPRAFVKLHKEYAGVTTAAALNEYFANRVSPDKTLSGGLIFVHDFKRSIAGKINKRALKDLKPNTNGHSEPRH